MVAMQSHRCEPSCIHMVAQSCGLGGCPTSRVRGTREHASGSTVALYYSGRPRRRGGRAGSDIELGSVRARAGVAPRSSYSLVEVADESPSVAPSKPLQRDAPTAAAEVVAAAVDSFCSAACRYDRVVAACSWLGQAFVA